MLLLRSPVPFWVFVNGLLKFVNKILGSWYACVLSFHIDVCVCVGGGPLCPTLGGRVVVVMRQEREKPGKFLGKWNGETETKQFNKAKQFEQHTDS